MPSSQDGTREWDTRVRVFVCACAVCGALKRARRSVAVWCSVVQRGVVCCDVVWRRVVACVFVSSFVTSVYHVCRTDHCCGVQHSSNIKFRINTTSCGSLSM